MEKKIKGVLKIERLCMYDLLLKIKYYVGIIRTSV